MPHNFAFLGQMERYDESVCLMHLKLGGAPATESPFSSNSNRATPPNLDWHAEAAACGLSALLEDDPLDERVYELAARAMDETRDAVEKADSGALAACLELSEPV